VNRWKWTVAAGMVALALVGLAFTQGGRDLGLALGVAAFLVASVGLVPFLLGLAAQLMRGEKAPPGWSLWAGAAVVMLPSALWNQPSIVLFGSRAVGVGFGFLWATLFIDYGARTARAHQRRRSLSSSEHETRVEA
jgi:hypothetical protein